MKQVNQTLIIDFISQFYQKIIYNHPDQAYLAAKFRFFKKNQILKSGIINKSVKSVKINESDIMNNQYQVQSTIRFEPNYTQKFQKYGLVGQKQGSEFFKILGYGYMINLIYNEDKKLIYDLKQEIQTQQKKQLTNEYIQKVLKKVLVILNYLLKMKVGNDNSKIQKMKQFLKEDRHLLSEFIKHMLLKRKIQIKKQLQNKLNEQIITKIALIMNLNINIFKLTDKDIIKNEYNGDGKMSINMGLDLQNGKYIYLFKKIENNINNNQKGFILKNLMKKFQENNQTIYKMNIGSKNFMKNITIKQKLRALSFIKNIS